jgi:hypothetical protein
MQEKISLDQIGSQLPKGTERETLPDGREVFDFKNIANEQNLGKFSRERRGVATSKKQKLKIIEKSPNIVRNVYNCLREEEDAKSRKDLVRYSKYYLKKEKDTKSFREARKKKRDLGKGTLEERAESAYRASQKGKIARRLEEDSDIEVNF